MGGEWKDLYKKPQELTTLHTGPVLFYNDLVIDHFTNPQQGSIRFSLGRDNTEEEIDYTIDVIENAIRKLRSISSQWQTAEKKAL